MKISIVFDNKAREGFKSGWGFSCLIENGNSILFDTGCEGHSLIYNINKLGCAIKDISTVVISHQHGDHTGGLFDLLNINNNLKVVVLSSFSKHFKGEIRRKAKLCEIQDEEEIAPGIYTTGLLKSNPDEQALILKTANGIVVIVGCSHPGVDIILEKARNHGNVYAIIGGFHGFSNFDALKDVKMICACHCTKYVGKIKKRFPNQYKEIMAGDVIEI